MVYHTANLIVFGSNLFTAILFIGLGIPLIKHKIKPNKLYGIRTKFSFSSESNWFSINEYGGKVFCKAGVFLAILSPTIFLINSETEAIGFCITSMFGIFLVLPITLILIMNHQKKLSNKSSQSLG